MRNFRPIAVALLIFVLAVVLRFLAGVGPFTSPGDDPQAALANTAAFHHQLGVSATWWLPHHSLTPLGRGKFRRRIDLERPLAGPLYLALFFKIFGQSPASSRLAVLPFQLAGLLALFLLARRMYGDFPALAATGLLAILPVSVILEPRSAMAAATLGLSLVALWSYFEWVDYSQPSRKWIMWLCYAVAVTLDWSVYVLALVVPVHHATALTKARRRWPPVTAWPVFAAVYFGLHLLVTRLALGSLLAPGSVLIAWKQAFNFHVEALMTQWGAVVVLWWTLPVVLLTVMWLVLLVRPPRMPDMIGMPRLHEGVFDPRIPIAIPNAPLWVLAALGFLPLIAAPAWAASRPHAWILATPFLVLAAAKGVERLALGLQDGRQRVVVRAVALGIAAVVALGQFIVVWPASMSPQRDLGDFIRRHAKANTLVLATMPDGGPVVAYYSRRRVIWGVENQARASAILKSSPAPASLLVTTEARIKKDDWLYHLSHERKVFRIKGIVGISIEKKGVKNKSQKK